MSKITLKFQQTSGRRLFGRDNRLKQATMQATSQKVEVLIKETMLEGQEKALARMVQAQYVTLTRAYYQAVLRGCRDLIFDSHVPVKNAAGEYMIDRMVSRQGPAWAVNRGRVRSKSLPDVREFGSFTAVVRHTERIVTPNMSDLGQVPDTESVQLNLQWSNLSPKYARRAPRSVKFFTKRSNPAKSQRLAFHKVMNTLLAQAKRDSAYSRPTTVFDYDKTTGTLRAQFRLTFPYLGEFDYIRKAFLSGKVTAIEDASGISGAEYLRPFIRPYAAEMGRRWRDTMRKASRSPLPDLPKTPLPGTELLFGPKPKR